MTNDATLQCPSCARPLRFVSAVFVTSTERWRCFVSCGAETVIITELHDDTLILDMDATFRDAEQLATWRRERTGLDDESEDAG